MKNYEFKSSLRNFIYAIKYDFTKFLKFTFQIYIYMYILNILLKTIKCKKERKIFVTLRKEKFKGPRHGMIDTAANVHGHRYPSRVTEGGPSSL